MNITSSLTGPKSQFLAAEYKTFRQVFAQVYIFPVEDKNDVEETQNIMLVAMKSSLPPDLDSQDAELTHYLPHLWVGVLDPEAPILTDDFVPVDQLLAPLLSER